MKEKLRIDFDKILKITGFSEKEIETKKHFLERFIENGFPNRKLENRTRENISNSSAFHAASDPKRTCS